MKKLWDIRNSLCAKNSIDLESAEVQFEDDFKPFYDLERKNVYKHFELPQSPTENNEGILQQHAANSWFDCFPNEVWVHFQI